MKIIILITSCYLLCRFIKPIWKAFFVGAIGYIVISYFIISAGQKLNSENGNVFYLFGQFLGDFIIGFAIFSVFKKNNKSDNNKIESSTTHEANDSSLNQ